MKNAIEALYWLHNNVPGIIKISLPIPGGIHYYSYSVSDLCDFFDKWQMNNRFCGEFAYTTWPLTLVEDFEQLNRSENTEYKIRTQFLIQWSTAELVLYQGVMEELIPWFRKGMEKKLLGEFIDNLIDLKNGTIEEALGEGWTPDKESFDIHTYLLKRDPNGEILREAYTSTFKVNHPILAPLEKYFEEAAKRWMNSKMRCPDCDNISTFTIYTRVLTCTELDIDDEGDVCDDGGKKEEEWDDGELEEIVCGECSYCGDIDDFGGEDPRSL